ncbi:MAG TPA: protein kinase, partial [Thermoanaerobaculia bacterium]|nr:protein kinase [Thermoanaerobaculia bacterium]
MSEQPLSPRYGEYDVESFLGKGSIGKVYLARHRRIGRRVALKTVHLEQKFEDDADRDEFYKRLQREAELCAVMQHPNIVTLYDVGYEEDLVSYLATEYVDGESLLARLRRTRPLPVAAGAAEGEGVRAAHRPRRSVLSPERRADHVRREALRPGRPVARLRAASRIEVRHAPRGAALRRAGRRGAIRLR